MLMLVKMFSTANLNPNNQGLILQPVHPFLSQPNTFVKYCNGKCSWKQLSTKTQYSIYSIL